MIRFEGVTKRYAGGPAPTADGSGDGSAVAVDDLSLTAPTGQITVLVGPSGCGKTTTLRMVNRMVIPTSGTITLDGRDTAALDAAELRRGIGYVIQHAGLFPHRTVVDNVATVPRLLGWDKRRARDRAMEVLARVGLDATYASRYPAQLSGGQQQRVGVARALAADPPVLLMDEPFSAVDPVVREQLQADLLTLQQDLAKTILFVTHDIDEAITLGDQIAVLRVGGRLAQVDTPERLLAAPADDFVADFVGRDRGYRALAFQPPPRVDLTVEPTVPLGATPAQARAATSDGWLLVVDSAGMPVGWVRPDQLTAAITPTDLHRGGTVARRDAPPRAYLDAALSSPSGRGVIAEADGRLAGTVTARAVVAALPHGIPDGAATQGDSARKAPRP
jgi:osmoprotectant transport system ATP-binding protein